MDRALPEFNTVLHKKWIQDAKRMHRKKLQLTTSRVDNSLPSSYNYPIVKSKKEMIIEDRCTEIERANRILLQRMTSILAGPATHMIHQSQTARHHSVGRKRGNTAMPTSSKGGRSVLMSEMEETKHAQEFVSSRYSKADRSKSQEKRGASSQLIVEEDGEGAENGVLNPDKVNNFYET